MDAEVTKAKVSDHWVRPERGPWTHSPALPLLTGVWGAVPIFPCLCFPISKMGLVPTHKGFGETGLLLPGGSQIWHPLMATLLPQLLGFGSALLDNVDPNPENFVGAGIIQTKALQVGCLLRLEPNAQAQVSGGLGGAPDIDTLPPASLCSFLIPPLCSVSLCSLSTVFLDTSFPPSGSHLCPSPFPSCVAFNLPPVPSITFLIPLSFFFFISLVSSSPRALCPLCLLPESAPPCPPPRCTG